MSQLPKDIITYIKDLEERVNRLERSSQIKNIKIPSGGKLVLPQESSDPPIENARIYVSPTQAKICIGGVWRVVTVT